MLILILLYFSNLKTKTKHPYLNNQQILLFHEPWVNQALQSVNVNTTEAGHYWLKKLDQLSKFVLLLLFFFLII